MTDIALYPGDRGTGKTTLILQQMSQAAAVGQSVAALVPTATRQRDFYYEMKLWDDTERSPIVVFTEANFQSSRGFRLDHIFIDDADLFLDNPIQMAEHFHPGVPLTVAYTPRQGFSLDTTLNI
jgi:RecA/RadA recombinase